MTAPEPQRVAIVLSGGGARGAYEAGVVSGIVQVLSRTRPTHAPFSIFTGTSVGAINAAWLAAHADRTDMHVEGLLDHWRDLDLSKHLSLDPLRFLAGASLGPRLARWRNEGDERWGRSLLDPKALEKLVETAVPYDRLHRNIREGVVRGLIVAALQISTARTTMFAELAPGEDCVPARDGRRRVQRTEVDSRHVLASAAIPLLFPSRKIGSEYYCDGGVRFNTPIAPAIRTGANKLVVISLLFPTAPAGSPEAHANVEAYPSPVFLMGKVLNALLLDPVHYDLHVLERFNSLLHTLNTTLEPDEIARVQKVFSETRGLPYRELETLVFRPSEDIGRLAHEHARAIAGRNLTSLVISRIAGLGADIEADLLSFILFDGEFAASLAALGRHDAMSRADEIIGFFQE